MTQFLRDILRQPNELKRTIDFLSGAGRPALDAATTAIRRACNVYMTGIGNSWHAALCAATLFNVSNFRAAVSDDWSGASASILSNVNDMP